MIRARGVVVVGFALAALVVSGCGSGTDAGEARGLGGGSQAREVCVYNRVGGVLFVTPLLAEDAVLVEDEGRWCITPDAWPYDLEVVLPESELGWALQLDGADEESGAFLLDAVNMVSDEESVLTVTPGQVVDLPGYPSLHVEYGDDIVFLRFED